MSIQKKYYDHVSEYNVQRKRSYDENFICPDCGAVIKKSSYRHHKESDKHKNNMRKNSDVIAELEHERDDIERIYNKKIRAVIRKRDHEVEKINNRLTNVQ